MSHRPKQALSAARASEIIADVEASDRDAARRAISGGVQVAQEQWIAAHLIVEALADEILDITRHSTARAEVAGYLRKLAHAVEARPDVDEDAN